MNVVPMGSGAAAEYGRETAFTPNAGIVAEGATDQQHRLPERSGAFRPGEGNLHDAVKNKKDPPVSRLAGPSNWSSKTHEQLRGYHCGHTRARSNSPIVAPAATHARIIGPPGEGRATGVKFYRREMLVESGTRIWHHHPRCRNYE